MFKTILIWKKNLVQKSPQPSPPSNLAVENKWLRPNHRQTNIPGSPPKNETCFLSALYIFILAKNFEEKKNRTQAT